MVAHTEHSGLLPIARATQAPLAKRQPIVLAELPTWKLFVLGYGSIVVIGGLAVAAFVGPVYAPVGIGAGLVFGPVAALLALAD